MKEKFTFLILVCAATFSCLGQSTINNVTGDLSEINRFRTSVRILKEIMPDSTTFEGSPFLTDLFQPADVTNIKGDTFRNIPMRYNIFNDNFEFIKDSVPYILPSKGFADKIVINNHSFVFTQYNYKIEKDGFLEVITEGKISLFKLYRMTYEPPEEPIAYRDAKKGRFRQLTNEYLISKPGELPVLIQNQKQLFQQFPEIEDELKSLIKSQKLKIKKENDVLIIVEYINSKL